MESSAVRPLRRPVATTEQMSAQIAAPQAERKPFVTFRLCGAPHNRNYAARTIMRSPRREVLPAAVFRRFHSA